MCPGGYVVNASSEEGRLAINGMSYNDRNSENANSAIVVTITPDDFGKHPLDGIEYQRRLEEKAYKAGKGNSNRITNEQVCASGNGKKMWHECCREFYNSTELTN